jgi:hypothetical protein
MQEAGQSFKKNKKEVRGKSIEKLKGEEFQKIRVIKGS